jgi:hypothetical protein
MQLRFLPPYHSTSLIYLHQLSCGEKLAIDQFQVKRITIPKLPELAVHVQWEEALKLDGFLKYMPDEYSGNSRTPRDFFYTVLSTLAPMYIKVLLTNINEERHRLRLEAK